MSKETKKEEKKKAIVKPTQFEVGDYVVAKARVYLKVAAVVDSGLGPMYGMIAPTKTSMGWLSQYELNQDEYFKQDPPLEKYYSIKAGDILRIGSEKNDVYVTVLARAGDSVLLSKAPKKGLAEQMMKLHAFVKDMAEDMGESVEELLGEDEMRELKRMGSQLHSSKIAGEWVSIEWLCLMHWDWIEE